MDVLLNRPPPRGALFPLTTTGQEAPMPKRKAKLKQPVTPEGARSLVSTLHSEQSSPEARLAAACRVLDLVGLAPQPRHEVTMRSEVVTQRVPATREFLLQALGDAAPSAESGPAR